MRAGERNGAIINHPARRGSSVERILENTRFSPGVRRITSEEDWAAAAYSARRA